MAPRGAHQAFASRTEWLKASCLPPSPWDQVLASPLASWVTLGMSLFRL